MKRLTPGKPYLIRADATVQPVNVMIGVAGSVQGLVIYGMELAMAKSVIRATAGSPVAITDPISDSALGELGAVVTRVALSSLEDAGYPCRTTPPMVMRGTGIKFSSVIRPMVVVPITTDEGEMKIYLGLQETESPAQE